LFTFCFHLFRLFVDFQACRDLLIFDTLKVFSLTAFFKQVIQMGEAKRQKRPVFNLKK
jgi:hypothetical protein